VTAASLITEAMRGAVGRELSRGVSFPVSESDIRRWAVAVYYPDPPPALFWDADEAALTSHKGIVAPEEFNPFAWMAADGPRTQDAETGSSDPDITEKRLGIPPPGLLHRLNGGVTVDYGVRMRPGDVITWVRSLGSYTERIGGLGQMLFTVFDDTWTNQNDEFVKRSRTTLIRY